MQAAFVDIATEKAAFLYVADVMTNMDDYGHMMEEAEEVEEEPLEFEETSEATQVPVMTRPKKGSSQTIEDLLQEGQEVVVQVSKEPIGTKGPRVTTYISLPGRYLVYMPTVNHVGVSRRIGREDERHRLKDMILRLRKPGPDTSFEP